MTGQCELVGPVSTDCVRGSGGLVGPVNGFCCTKLTKPNTKRNKANQRQQHMKQVLLDSRKDKYGPDVH